MPFPSDQEQIRERPGNVPVCVVYTIQAIILGENVILAGPKLSGQIPSRLEFGPAKIFGETKFSLSGSRPPEIFFARDFFFLRPTKRESRAEIIFELPKERG